MWLPWSTKKRERHPQPHYSALIDSSTGIALALSIDVSSIVFLNETTLDTFHAVDVNFPHYADNFPLASIKPASLPGWTWSSESRKFTPTHPEALTDHMRAKSLLASQKGELVRFVIDNLNVARYSVRTGLEFQETVYITKKMQAYAFRDTGYPEEKVFEYPYVVQYADFAGLSLKAAADDILFKAKLDDELLAKTELLRLKYFNAIKNAKTPNDLPAIHEVFVRECYKNALV